jgi:membrane dipeptidase
VFLFLRVPTGLDDVSKYPDLFAELLRDGWSEADLAKVAGGNVLRVLEDNEKVGMFCFLNLF